MKKYLPLILSAIFIVSLLFLFEQEIKTPFLATDSGFDVGGGGGSGSSGGGSSSSSGGGGGTPIPFKYGVESAFKLFLAIGMIISAESAEDKKASTSRKVVLTILFLIAIGCSIDCFFFSLSLFLPLLVLDLMITLGYIATLFPPSEEYKKLRELSYYKNDEIIKMLEERDASLDNEENLKIAEEAYQIYYDVQMAWMNFDYKKLRTLVTDELYNMYQAQLRILKFKEQQNVMEDFNPVQKNVVSREKMNGIETIKVLLFVEFYDYIKDKDENVVSGYKTTKVNVSYLLTYVVNEDSETICSGCGAELSDRETECSYCHTKIQAVGNKMRLAKKEVLKQHY